VAVKTFYVGIKGVIVKDGKVLVLRPNAAQGRHDNWEVPGGRIDDDESIEQTLNRELLEEVPNIKNVRIREILHAFRLNKDIEGDKSLFLVYYRVTADFDGDPQISDEHVDWKWIDLNEAKELMPEQMLPAIQRILEQ
jgi:8-oxo-dGTP diphosphatase